MSPVYHVVHPLPPRSDVLMSNKKGLEKQRAVGIVVDKIKRYCGHGPKEESTVSCSVQTLIRFRVSCSL